MTATTVTVPTLLLILPFCIVVGVAFALAARALLVGPFFDWIVARSKRRVDRKTALLRQQAEALRSEQSDDMDALADG